MIKMLPNPDKLDVDINGLHWFRILIGLSFGTFGLLVFSSPIIKALNGGLRELLGMIGCGPLGLLIIGMGVGLSFYKSGVTLDFDADTITEWSGIFHWRKKKEHPLKDFGRVTLKHYERTSGPDSISEINKRTSTHSAYTAALEGSGKKIILMDWREKEPVSKKAKEVASFLKVPLIDSSERKEVVTTAEDWDEILDE
jgi:hypothetical protein